MALNNEGYFFIGLGKKFIDECENLLLTLRKQNDLRPVSLLIHDIDKSYCEQKNIFDKLIVYNPEVLDRTIWDDCKTNFEKYCLVPRLFLPWLTPYEKTITVDSDMFCQGSTEDIWSMCNNSNKPLVMIGFKNDLSWHWGHLSEVISKYQKHIPCVHGGFFYYHKNNSFVDKFFNYAKELFFKYDEYGCKKWYQNGRVDEILFAICHAKFDIHPIDFDEYPIMTFNYSTRVALPSSLQTCTKNKEPLYMNKVIPFIHMQNDKLNTPTYTHILNNILSK